LLVQSSQDTADSCDDRVGEEFVRQHAVATIARRHTAGAFAVGVLVIVTSVPSANVMEVTLVPSAADDAVCPTSALRMAAEAVST